MKKVKTDFAKGIATVQAENRDDLWYLSQIIDPGDSVSSKTLRKLKIGGEDDRKQKVVKKPMFIRIRSEKIELQEGSLRVLGTIEDGPEDIQRGEHHSLSIEEGTLLTIEKDSWPKFQQQKLKEALDSKLANILIIVFDREEAYFALMKKYGFEIIGHIEGNVAKKGMDEGKVSNFYVEIVKQAKEYDLRYGLDHIILGSPAFWKDELLKNLNDENMRKKMVLATCSSTDSAGINELLKRDEVRSVLAGDRITKEINLVEALLGEVSTSQKAAYGFEDVKYAVGAGACETLIVSDSLIRRLREKEEFGQLNRIMKDADSMGANVHVISSVHEGGKKLDGLGGIGAILRYKLQF